MSKQIHLFVIKKDIIPGLQLTESRRRLKYILDQVYKEPKVEMFNSLVEDPNIGINLTGKSITGRQYLVMDSTDKVVIKKIKPSRGEVWYSLEGQLSNPTSISFLSGGIYQEKYLIAGRIGTASDNSKSIDLFNEFSRSITKGFTKIRNYYVGENALKLLDKGMPLITIGVGSLNEANFLTRE